MSVRIPREDLSRVANAQQRFEHVVSTLGDDVVRRPSLLPDWTVAHVLTHVARNADSHRRRAEASIRGEIVDQYPGGFPARTAEIEAGATRGAADLAADVTISAAAMLEAWQRLPDDTWTVASRDVGGRMRRLCALPARRWQELEVHLVDLDVGPSWRDWSDDFVAVWVQELRATAGARGASPAPDSLDERDELAWLYGRLQRADLPALAPWG